MSQNIAEANIARLRYPLTDERMAGMANRIHELNRLAEDSPGFIWRFEADDSDENAFSKFERYLGPFERDRLFFNMSIWKDVDSLKHYVYKTVHTEMLKDGHRWVESLSIPSFVMWRIEPKTRPTVLDSIGRFLRLKREGPTAEAFGFGSGNI